MFKDLSDEKESFGIIFGGEIAEVFCIHSKKCDHHCDNCWKTNAVWAIMKEHVSEAP